VVGQYETVIRSFTDGIGSSLDAIGSGRMPGFTCYSHPPFVNRAFDILYLVAITGDSRKMALSE